MRLTYFIIVNTAFVTVAIDNAINLTNTLDRFSISPVTIATLPLYSDCIPFE
ncbi:MULTISPECIES: hypothetical protein [unclassified Bartonella]|uniref:hypothetical protein n=1 Tax=unclassified Bartonella TaxID=2645622 RepID=UPI0035D0182D